MAKGYTPSERQFMDAIIETALRLHYKVMHINDRLYALAAKQGRYDALAGAEGFPDLLIVGYGVMFVIETKAQDGRTSLAQDEWLDAFAGLVDPMCGHCSDRIWLYVARPEQQTEIMEKLAYYRERSWAA